MQLLPLLFTTLTTAEYLLQSNFTGPSFLDNFDFYTSWDPTFGYVHYVDRATAEQYGMINVSVAGGPAIFGAEHTQVLDPDANLGRLSLRLSTKQSWTQGLFVADIAHMPGTACGLWPAFWSLGTGADPWPAYGEVDIIEYPNLASNNLMALHTKEGCSVAGADQTGTVLTNDCGKDLGFAGCYSSPTKPNNAGTDFNADGGGVYAMEWTSAAIKIWFFPREQIPASLKGPIPPDPTTFGTPDANFAGGCDIDKFFFNHSLIFNIEFCGSWAGPTFVDDGCPALDPTNQWRSCNIYAATNPQAYTEAYWAVNYLEVFTSAPGSPSPTSSFLSTVTPAASSTSVTDSGALGAPTTPTQSLWPPTSITTSSTSTSSPPSSSTEPPPSSSTSSSSSSSTPSPDPTTSTSSISTSSPSSPSPSTTLLSSSISSSSTLTTSTTAASSSPTTSQQPPTPSSTAPQVITIRTTTIVSVPAAPPSTGTDIITIHTTTTVHVPASSPSHHKRAPTGPPPGNDIGPLLRPSHATKRFDPEDPDETRIPVSWTFECCFEYASLPTGKGSASKKSSDDDEHAFPTAHSKAMS